MAADTSDRRWLASQLADGAQTVRLAAGTTIFNEGNPCTSLAFLVKGSVRVCKRSPNGRQVTLYRVHPGEACVLTTCCVLRQSAFPADAFTEGEIEALVVSADAFRTWFESEPFWRRFVIELVSDRIGQLLGLVDAVVFKRTDVRLAQYLLTHARVDSGSVELTHEAAAAEIGTAREVVSRILERFASVGVVQTQRGRVEILDMQRLGEIADPDPT